jgi:heptosyltransferase-1
MYDKILIVKPSSLGDIIHALPLLNLIKKEMPDSEVHWLVARGFEDILEGHPFIKRLFIINKDNWKNPTLIYQNIKEILHLSAQLKKERYDAVIDLQGLFRSGIISWLSRCPLKLGFSDARELSYIFYNRTIEGGKGIHAVERYIKIGRLLGINSQEISFPLFHIKPSPLREQYFVVVPGARWPSKRWPAGYFIRLLKYMDALGLTPVLLGAKDDIRLSEEIINGSKINCINLTGKTDLKELCSIIKDAKFMITNDSGPMHIATALGVKVFAIFGPTDEKLTGPYGGNHVVIKVNGLQCRPCRKRKCHTLECLKGITPEDVYRIITADKTVQTLQLNGR